MQQRLLRGPRALAAGLAACALVAGRRPARRLGPGPAWLLRASRPGRRWHLGHRPDTHDNQQEWPQPGSQKPGCGWPFINLTGLFCLRSGAVLRAAHERWKTSEARLITMERSADKDASRVMSARLWKRLPATITVRQVRVPIARAGFRTQPLLLLTTLLDPVLWSVETLGTQYTRRWRVELYFDDIKTTLQTSSRRCLTPAMVRRELLLHAIADNLIRRFMRQSARQHAAPLDQLSFKGTLDTLRHWQHTLAAARSAGAREEMLILCAADLLPLRPGRREPRVRKRRPKPYQQLTRPRRQMTVSPSRNDKGKPRKSTPIPSHK